MVSQSDLIGFSPRFFAEAIKEGLGLQVLEPPAPLTMGAFYMVWREETDGDPGLIWLRERFKARMAPYTGTGGDDATPRIEAPAPD